MSCVAFGASQPSSGTRIRTFVRPRLRLFWSLLPNFGPIPLLAEEEGLVVVGGVPPLVDGRRMSRIRTQQSCTGLRVSYVLKIIGQSVQEPLVTRRSGLGCVPPRERAKGEAEEAMSHHYVAKARQEQAKARRARLRPKQPLPLFVLSTCKGGRVAQGVAE